MRRLMSAVFAASLVAVFANAQMMGGMGAKGGSSMTECGNSTKSGGMMMGGMMGNKMMDDPEIQKMMSEEMMAHRKQMMQQRIEFQKSMHKKMMSSPKVIKYMLTNILEDPAAFKKTLDENPELKAKVKKAL